MIFEEFNSTCLFKVSKYCHYHSTPVLCSHAHCPRFKSEAAFQKRLELETQNSKLSSFTVEDFSLNKIANVKNEEIEKRFKEIKIITNF